MGQAIRIIVPQDGPQNGRGCCLPDPSLFDRMGRLVASQTDASLRDRFGISYHTWRKLRAGEPVRTSLIERLESRVRNLEAQAGTTA